MGQDYRQDRGLVERVADLVATASQAEVIALECICKSWLSANDFTISGDHTPVVESSLVGTLPMCPPQAFSCGLVLGSGLPGAVLEEDFGRLLQLSTKLPESCIPDCQVVLARSESCTCSSTLQAGCCCGLPAVRAHSLVLAARSGFFERALQQDMLERWSSTVFLGFLEDAGACGSESRSEFASEAFGVLLRFFYTGQTRPVQVSHLPDVMALLDGDFLNIPDAKELQQVCEEALECQLPIELAASVAGRADLLGQHVARRVALRSLAQHLAGRPQQLGVARQLVGDFSQEALVELVEELVVAASSQPRIQ